MPRKGPVSKTPTPGDGKYDSVLVTQLINRIMNDGKRSLAERIVYDALADIGGRSRRGWVIAPACGQAWA